MAIDFQAMLDDFANTAGAQTNPIREIYNIIPTYTPRQQRFLFIVKHFVEKWDLEDIRYVLREMNKTYLSNKNLGMIEKRTLHDLLAAYTQEDLIRGVKVQSYSDSSSGGGGQ